MPNQLKSIALSDVYCQAAKQYLQLIPVACLNAEALYLDTVKRAHSPDSGRVASPPPSTTSSSPTPSLTIERLSTPSIPTIAGPASTNPFDVPPPPPSSSSGRPRSGSNSSCSSHTSLSSVTNPTSTSTISQAHSADEVQRLVFEHVPLEVAYFAALEEAQGAIETCASRCRGWSSRYDMCTGGPGHPRKEAEGVGKGGGDLDGNHDYGSVFRSRSATLSQTGRMQNENRLHPSMNGNHGDGGGPLARTSSFSRSSGVSPIRTRKLAELKFDEDKAGLFLKVLFERLMNMLTQPPAVNLLLTRLVARLAHYPQPLLRSLLLNHQLVLVSGVPNLFTVRRRLRGLPLRGLPLRGLPLRGLPLRGLPLRGLPLRGLPLRGLPLRGLPLRGLPLRGLPLRGLPLRGVPLRGVPLRGVPLRGVPLRGVPLRGLPLRGLPIRGFACIKLPDHVWGWEGGQGGGGGAIQVSSVTHGALRKQWQLYFKRSMYPSQLPSVISL